MTRHDEHLRQKALQLRAEHQLSLDEIVERLKLPRGTVYHWIKDIPIPPRRQQAGQRLGTAAMQAKYAALRDAAYAQGLAEAPERLRTAGSVTSPVTSWNTPFSSTSTTTKTSLRNTGLEFSEYPLL
jgi:hypothetical protein